MSFDLLLTEEAVCTDKHPNDPNAKVVACTSSEAAFQMVGKGQPISAEDAARFGVKTKKADETNYTLLIDSHTIARTPEEKAYAATQPQPGLVRAQTERIRAAAALSVASLSTNAARASTDAESDAKKADAAADKKAKASLETKTAAAAKKAPRAKTARVTKAAATKKADAAKTEAEKTPANA